MYAIIEDSGTQIRVREGDVINVATRELTADAATITFDKVLMISDGANAKIGTPLVEGAQVTADVLAEDKTRKVTIIKFKRRKDYKRKKGHRQAYLKVRVTSIRTKADQNRNGTAAQEAG